ncbi:hypothetical protein [Pelagibius sp.]|uniref:hypothetical protein n=1 Tax=Pelagibius sp. TaxID=1931238 RepID=UPI00262EBB36|nr:hypothetical protein [Pelagibius sp.]
MLTKRAITTCAAVALATVFTVQQGEHGPLVVYKLKVPKEAARTVKAPAASTPAASTPAESTPVARTPAVKAPKTVPTVQVPALKAPVSKTKTPKLSSLTPTILGRVVMPAGTRPDVSPGVTTAPSAALAPPVTAAPLTPTRPTALPPAAPPPTVSPLTAADRAIVAPASATVHAGFANTVSGPASSPVYRSVSGLPVGDSLMNEETGEPLTLDAVQDVIEWRRDTVDSLPQLQSTPRF